MKANVTFILYYNYEIDIDKNMSEKEIIEQALNYLYDDTSSTWYDEYSIDIAEEESD